MLIFNNKSNNNNNNNNNHCHYNKNKNNNNNNNNKSNNTQHNSSAQQKQEAKEKQQQQQQQQRRQQQQQQHQTEKEEEGPEEQLRIGENHNIYNSNNNCSSNKNSHTHYRLTKQQQQQQRRRQQQQQQQLISTHQGPHTRPQRVTKFIKSNTSVAVAVAANVVALVYPVLMLFVLLSAAPAPAHADWLMDCGDCHCKWNSGKKTADCKNLSLSAVPENLSSEVQVLDLSYNRIPYLEQNAFLSAQLQNLHKLFIRNSSLAQIDPRSFTQLEILIELDLSNNLLRTLQPNLFGRLIKVRALVLNGNLLESLGDGVFQNLKYLHKIELKHNRLMRFGTQVFSNVPLLSQIYLDGNRLSFLRKETFESLKRLTALSLDQNPWNCTCELQVFRDFVLKRNLYTPPTSCHYPLHLRDMLWIEDQPEAFACKPKIIYPARGASINTSKENVTLICRVHASPNTLISWDYNKQTYRASMNAGSASSASNVLAPSLASSASASSSSSSSSLVGVHQSQRVHIQLHRDEQSKEKEFGRDVFISRLTILGAEKSDEGIYTCFAENAGGKDAVQMSLLVQKPGPRDLLMQGNLLIVISLMALGLLSVSVFLAMVTCCIYKRFKNLNAGHHHRHLHHLNMNTADQLTAGEHGGGVTTATTNVVVAGGTDVMLGDVHGSGGGGDFDDDNSLSRYKQHKTMATLTTSATATTNLNGGAKHNKYADVIKQHQVGSGAVKDNGLIVGYVGGGGIGAANGSSDAHQLLKANSGVVASGASDAEKSYLERSNEDTLKLKYPHGIAVSELSYASLATHTNATGTATPTTMATLPGAARDKARIDERKQQQQQQQQQQHHGYATSPNSNIEIVGRTVEYQPDLLPAYGGVVGKSNNHKQQQQQQQQLYSPVKSLRTINAKETPAATRSKYNINVQEYLQAKYGSLNKPTTTISSPTAAATSSSSMAAAAAASAANINNNSSSKTNKREAPSIPLTASASLSTAYAVAGAASASSASPSASQESGFSTLQRHCKSLALSAHRSGGSTAATTSTPTDSHGHHSSGYEYRQPPPPPYNAPHRTSGASVVSGLLSLQRRTNASAMGSNNALGIGIGSSMEQQTEPSHLGMVGVDITSGTTLTQTIVTASPSLNFLTTTGSYTPRRQLL